MNYVLKLLDYTSHKIRNVSCEIAIFYGALSHEAMLHLILSLCKFGNDQSKKQINNRSLLALQKGCMPPGIKYNFKVAPTYPIKHLF